MRISDWSSDVCSSDLAASVSSTTESSALTACLKTSFPVISTLTPALCSSGLNPTDTPTGFHSNSFLAPSACRCVPRMPVSSSAFSTTAPTPSPNSTQVLRRSEEHTSELQSLMRISYAVFCLQKNITQ